METRQEHLDWCKKRALEYVELGDLTNAFASMISDVPKHESTQKHIGIELGMQLMFGGFLSTKHEMEKWITGFN